MYIRLKHRLLLFDFRFKRLHVVRLLSFIAKQTTAATLENAVQKCSSGKSLIAVARRDKDIINSYQYIQLE